MERQIDLLNGRIVPALTRLALPIMATAMIQTAYSLTDMAWIGRVGSDAVAAVGAAGMYIWLSGGIVALARMGGQIKVAHSFGEGRLEEAACYAGAALQLTIFLAVLFGLTVNVFTGPLIGFFGLNNVSTIQEAQSYLRIAGGVILFSFLNLTLTGIFTAIGDSATPFAANGIGLIINIILDPVLIFGIGPFPCFGVKGAAIATVTAQFVVTLAFAWRAAGDTVLFNRFRLRQRVGRSYFDAIIRLGIPSSVQNLIYCGISMILTKMVASWGDAAVAVQRLGGQIESISWMTADGFAAAMNAFSGQNFGAGNYRRLRKGYGIAVVMVFIWGMFTTLLLVLGAEPIFGLFIKEEAVIPIGVRYLTVIGYSQMFMCEELMTVGTLQGMGKTFHTSVISVLLTSMRIPLAVWLAGSGMGLDGIWWALAVSSMVKGVVFVIYCLYSLRTENSGVGRNRR